MKQAIWLYLYLLTVANRKNGQLFRRLKTIAAETSFHPRSIERWLKCLREKGYIETYSTGRFLQISITKWKPISKKDKKVSISDAQLKSSIK
ncbi:MAG: helix-turn-helix domain-containing protein [Pyrinomonadaceae bacterium]